MTNMTRKETFIFSIIGFFFLLIFAIFQQGSTTTAAQCAAADGGVCNPAGQTATGGGNTVATCENNSILSASGGVHCVTLANTTEQVPVKSLQSPPPCNPRGIMHC